ncbi:unnamed protein product [Mytilus coruscus]|uniref:Uncharacterized protein n=1 Tax=Mytilus coruscus TaxID=42192 RepID=A0A6J8B8C2_MYTCO|nr:unnamed protein product [Mytilus coruscus]
MCQHIVGTEDHVKQIRFLNVVRDNLSISKNQISITSGSFREGLEMRGSDLDIMIVVRNIEVYDVKPRLNQHTSYLSMDTDDVKPGFTQLRLEENCSKKILFERSVQIADKYYLSSTLWKHGNLPIGEMFRIHGPCISDKDELSDIVESLHCKTWVSSAKKKYLMSFSGMVAYNLLGVALRLLGDTESARQSFLQSAKINPDASRNFAVNRLLLMS